MPSGIFLRDGEQLQELDIQQVLLESDLQILLARYPELLGLVQPTLSD